MGKKILVVDDHQGTASKIGKTLGLQGREVSIRLSLAQGLEALNSKPFDAVVTDLEMGRDADAGLKMVQAATDKGIKAIALVSAIDASRIPLVEKKIADITAGSGRFFSKRDSTSMEAMVSFVNGEEQQRAK